MNDRPDRSLPSAPEIRTVPPRRRRGRIGLAIVVVLLAGAGFILWHRLGSAPRAARQGQGASQSVGVATIGTGDLDVVLSGLGAVTPLATVTVKTQINGQLQQIGFTEGQLVHKGDFLAQIDPRPYQVALEQAQGTLARDTALLAQARADNARYQTLGRQDSISRQQVDDQAFLIKQYEGAVTTDQGAVDSARLNLAYCHIVAPVEGRVGIRMVDEGNYVQTSDTGGLVVVTEVTPISVLFSLPEDDIGQIRQQMEAGALAVTAYDRGDAKLLATGTLAATDNQVDATTGTVKLRALFANADGALFPQQFVNAHLLVQTMKGVVVAPVAAIQHGAPGDFVYLLKPDGTVSIQVVKTGVSQGDRVQVTTGLKAGDKVVTDGLDRLRDGAKVTIAQPQGAQPQGAQPQGAQPAGAAAPAAQGQEHGRRQRPPAAG